MNKQLIIIRGLPGTGKSTLAHNSCQLSVNDGMANGLDCIIVSNTFTTADEIQPYLDLAEKYGYAVKVIRMTKEYGSIHGVPDKSMERMRRRMVDYAGEVIHEYD